MEIATSVHDGRHGSVLNKNSGFITTGKINQCNWNSQKAEKAGFKVKKMLSGSHGRRANCGESSRRKD
jgi:hypothetical protein